MNFLALVGAALFGVGWIDGFSLLTLPDMTGMVGFCPNVTSFVYLILNIHVFKNLACCLVVFPLKVPDL